MLEMVSNSANVYAIWANSQCIYIEKILTQKSIAVRHWGVTT